MSDLENNVDEDGGFSLAQLAGFDASDVAEIRFENLPGGAYVFNGTGVKLEKTKNREDETRFKLTINLEVAEVKAVTERGVNKEELVGKKHNESFYIVPAKAEEGIGLIRAFYADIGLPNGDRKSVVEGKRVSVRVDHGGGRYIKKKKNNKK